MAKTKWTSGVLATDKDGDVVFFPCVTDDEVYLDMPLGWWQIQKGAHLGNILAWKAGRFQRLYDLRDEHNKPCKPPRAGTAIEVDLEL